MTAGRPVAPERRVVDPFLVWGLGATVAFTAAALALALRRNGGHLIYVIDDPAIHLSMAHTLAHSGTWGIEAGAFEAASSSPGWTVVLAATTLLLPRFEEWVPLLLNLAAAGVLLAVLGRSQTLLRPGRGRLLDGAVVIMIALGPLFLPGLAATGMEHTLHAALVVVAVDRLTRLRSGAARPVDHWLPYAALAGAAVVRFETLFVAAGLGTGLVLGCLPRLSPDGRATPLRRQVTRAVGCGLAAGVPVLAVGVLHLAMGRSFWPNSVMSKTVLGGNERAITTRLSRPYETVRLLGRDDPVVLGLTVLAVVVVVWAWYGGPKRHVLPAITLLITVWLHTALARYGWFERYQAYLIAMGVYVVLGWASDVVRPAGRKPALVAALVVIALVAPYKFKLLSDVPLGSNNTYSQRYQVGRFVDRHYADRPVATSELGYVSLLHDGPVVDVLGLGTHDVLTARERSEDGPEFWRRLMDEREVEVVAIYPGILPEEDVPPQWELVGIWHLSGRLATGVHNDFQFWAPRPELVAPLQDNLEEFASELPDTVEAVCVPCLRELAEDRDPARRAPPGATPP